MPGFLRFFLLVSCLITGLSSAYAQQENFFNRPEVQSRTFFSGIVAGINASQVDGDYYSGFHKAGLNAGVLSYVKLNPNFLLSIEILYSMKGARDVSLRYNAAVGTAPEEYRLNLNYVEIPLMLHINAGYGIHLGAGLSYSRLLSSTESFTTGSGPVNLNTDANTFRSSDLDYLVSVQYQLYKGLFARARYQYSAISIRDADKIPQQFGSPAQFNNYFALQLICLF